MVSAVVAATATHYITDTQIHSIQNLIIRIGCECIFFGIHATMFIISTYLLFSKGIKAVKARIFLLALTLTMFCASLGVIAIDMSISVRQIKTYGITAPTTKELNLQLRLASNVLMRLNFLLGDIVVVWRTWVIWPSFKVHVLLAICMLGTIGAVVGNGTKAALDLVRNTPASNSYSLVMTLPPLITNLVATSLMGLKLWEYRRNVTASIRTEKSIEKLLLILVESGIVFCLIWLLILLAGFTIFTSANNILILGVAVSLTGIYPTFIVIMVSLEKSQANTIVGTGAMPPLQFRHTAISSYSSRPTATSGQDIYLEPKQSAVESESSPVEESPTRRIQ
ncbi:hypothetical protein C8J56DRAFT_1044589 [Mycena floridula]|nr:hypothetical protein C8J56DRAFT_1044589 [Mycena floridula]